MNKTGMTRRSLTSLLAAAPLVAQVASTPQNPPTTATAPPAKATDDIRKVSDRLGQTEVPMSIEPAFNFHAL